MRTIFFLLLPILEIVFSGSLDFRPDWPEYVPADSFLLVDKDIPQVIEVINDGDFSLFLEYDAEKRLIKFPYFFENGSAQVTASYGISSSLLNLSIYLANEGTDSQTIEIDFPSEFLPFSRFSPGGSFQPIKAVYGSETFYVYLFEAQSFLTETWYSSEGSMIVFAKANINHIEERWRINSLQIHGDSELGSDSVQFIDYFFDSFGNITEIRYGDKVFSALYRGNRPIYRSFEDVKFSLQWDTLSMLRNVVVNDREIEYRYEYILDGRGNWTSRRAAVFSNTEYLLVPQAAGNQTINRRIIY